jgi:tetratricopeptide (TPR) repeat protein
VVNSLRTASNKRALAKKFRAEWESVLRALVLLLLCFVGLQARASSAAPVKFAALPPHFADPNSEGIHWKYSLPFFLRDQLRQVKMVFIPEDQSLAFGQDESVGFGFTTLKSSGRLDLPAIIQIGKAIDVQKVLWSDVDYKQGTCRWSGVLVDVPSGSYSSNFNTTFSQPWNAVCQMRNLVLHKLGLQITSAQQEELDRPPTTNHEALESLSRALFAKNYGEPLSTVTSNLLRAVSLDPRFPLALDALATLHLAQNRLEEAEDILDQSLTLNRSLATTHFLRGELFLRRGLNALAKAELLRVRMTRPSDPLALIDLAELSGRREGNWKNALSSLETARELEPYSAFICEELGTAYAYLAEPGKSTTMLRTAERYDTTPAGLVTVRLADAFALLGDAPRAVHYYQEFLLATSQIGFTGALVDDAKAALGEQQLRLTPRAVHGSMPPLLTSAQLKALLKKKLTKEELLCITDPLLSTSGMREWAKSITLGCNTELEKARRIFTVLTPAAGNGYRSSNKTAEQAFRELQTHNAKLNCQDCTFLYVSAARAVGLKAFCVHVNRDCASNLVAHACAGVFIGGKAFLVDPAYNWFGAPHLEYEFLDDIRTIAFFLTPSPDLCPERCATKLAPDDPLVQFGYAIGLSAHAQPREAESVLKAGLTLDSTSWLSFFARGLVHLDLGKSDEAVKDLEQCAGLHPDYPELHFYLGRAYARQGHADRARDEYRTFLECDPDSEFTSEAKAALRGTGSGVNLNYSPGKNAHRDTLELNIHP